MGRAKRVGAAALVSALMLAATAAPAMAFHHTAIPAGECAANEDASNNPTARSAITEHNPRHETIPPPLPPFGTSGEDKASAAGEQCHNGSA